MSRTRGIAYLGFIQGITVLLVHGGCNGLAGLDPSLENFGRFSRLECLPSHIDTLLNGAGEPIHVAADTCVEADGIALRIHLLAAQQHLAKLLRILLWAAAA